MATALSAFFGFLGSLLKSILINVGLYFLVRNKAISDVERKRLEDENAIKDKQGQLGADRPTSNDELAKRLRDHGW